MIGWKQSHVVRGSFTYALSYEQNVLMKNNITYKQTNDQHHQLLFVYIDTTYFALTAAQWGVTVTQSQASHHKNKLTG